MTMKLSNKMKQELRAEATLTLTHNYGISEGSTLYTFTQYIGNAGAALVRVYVMKDEKLYNITGLVAHAIEESTHTRDGKSWIKTTGNGYCRAEHVVNNLSWVLFKRGDAMAYKEM